MGLRCAEILTRTIGDAANDNLAGHTCLASAAGLMGMPAAARCPPLRRSLADAAASRSACKPTAVINLSTRMCEHSRYKSSCLPSNDAPSSVCPATCVPLVVLTAGKLWAVQKLLVRNS